MSQTQTNPTLPIKRVTGDTMEETLTNNAFNNILPRRYLLRDEDGNLDENPGELFNRVAKNVALADVIFEADKRNLTVEVSPDQLKENHGDRQGLAEDIFGKGTTLDDDVTTELTEQVAYAFSYDNVVPTLDDEELKEAVVKQKNSYEQLMTKLSFLPNSPTLMNAGAELQQLSACFVNSPDDDIEDIHHTVEEASKIFKSGGGTGYAFHHLRPYGDQVGSTGGIASGPISFMRTFDQMCETIAQGGKRRGAQMGVMRITHPDIIHFIHAKNKDVSLKETLKLNEPTDREHGSFEEAVQEASELIGDDGSVPKHLRNAVEGHLSNFNISVGITDDFMEAVKNNEDYTLYNPRTHEPHIVSEHTKEMYGWYGLDEYLEVGEEMTLPANKIWERVIEGSHENGEPGVVFIDRINEEHSFPVDSEVSNNSDDPMSKYVIHATNPCGEQPLMEYESCNLGHINLSTIVDEDAPDWRDFSADGPLEDEVETFLDEAVDWEDFDKRIALATQFLDNVVTMSDFPIEEITETVQNNRKIGLGIMGLAQMLIQMGVKYGSEPSFEVSRQLMKYINQSSKAKSNALANERGKFANWEDSKYADPTSYPDWFEKQTGEDPADWEDGFPVRNHNTTSIAPTGTTSMLGDTSGGCEPIFDVAYFKNAAQDVSKESMVEFDDYFLRTLEANGIDVSAVKEEAVEQMNNNEWGGIRGLSNVPDSLVELFVTSGDLSPIQHANVQTALQEGVDSAISKTINAPADATLEDAKEAFEFVYDNGGKGVTYYRDGTRMKQVNTTRAQNRSFSDETTAAHEIALQITDNFDSVVDFLSHEEAQEVFDTQLYEVARELVFDRDEIDAETKEEIAGAIEEITSAGGLNLNGDDNGYLHPRERPDTLHGSTQRVDTGYGKLYVIINEDPDGHPFEVFCNIGNSGGFTNSFTESLAKIISVALRSGVSPYEIKDELQGIRSPKIAWDRSEKISSIPDAIGTALDRHLNDDIEKPYPQQSTIQEAAPNQDIETSDGAETEDIVHTDDSDTDDDKEKDRFEEDQQELLQQGESIECPECGEPRLYISEGCKTCENCGWSEC